MNLFGCDIDNASRWTCDKHLVARLELTCLNGKLRHSEFREVLHALANILFALGGAASILAVPLSQLLPEIITIPETAVEYGGELCVPLVFLLRSECAIEHRADCFLIAFHHSIDILCAAGAALYLEHPHAGSHHLVDETDGLQVLWTHDVLVVHLQFGACLAVGDDIRAAAQLHASPAVGRAHCIVEREIALAAYRHAQRSVTEHLYANEFSAGTADVLLHYLAVDVGYLLHVQFAGKHHNIGKLCIEAQCLDVRDIELCGEMHLLTYLSTVCHHGNVTCNNCRNACFVGSINNLVHRLNVLAIDDGVHREVCLYAMFVTLSCDIAQVVDSEMVSTMRPHV